MKFLYETVIDKWQPYVIRVLLFHTIIALLLSSEPSFADWINLSGAENSRNIAEIYVEEDQVRIKLEIFVKDLLVFKELIPGDFFPEPIPDRPGTDDRIRIFSDQVFQIITDSGIKLEASVDLIEPRIREKRPSPLVGKINPYTRQIIPGPPEDKRVLYAELRYPFDVKPQSLSFIPPLDDKNFPEASIGFVCYHLGVPVVDFRQLSQPSKLNLAWDDPWYSTFTNKQLQRTLQSGCRTYLYIEPYEVRHEILVRVKDMMTWMDFDLRGDTYIEEDEFDQVRKQVADFFMEHEYVLIDGRQHKPILDRTAYVESSMLRSRFIEVPERVPLNTAMIGIVITYLTKGIPQEVVTEWNLFSDRIQKVAAEMTDPAGPFPYDLTADDNVLKWTNYLKNYTIPTVNHTAVAATHRGIPLPVFSLFCLIPASLLALSIVKRRRHSRPVRVHVAAIVILVCGACALLPYHHISIGSNVRAKQINSEESKIITHNLLKNVYRAFDFREETDIYDKLEISVSGDLLTDIYLQNRKSMLIEQAGGAQAQVKQIEVLEAQVTESKHSAGAIDVRSKWKILGTVGHWGHVHTRQNRYDAILTLAIVDHSWKITGIEVIEEKRINPLPR